MKWNDKQNFYFNKQQQQHTREVFTEKKIESFAFVSLQSEQQQLQNSRVSESKGRP
jgi:hypothetical protein